MIIRLLINAAALYATTRFVDGVSFTGSLQALLGVALVFGVVNTLIKPVIQFFSLPVIFLTLGLFAIAINAFMLMLTSSLSRSLGLGFSVRGFGAAFVGSIVVSLVSACLGVFVSDHKKD